MKEQKIKFREIESTDYLALEKIICDTWNYRKFCTDKTAMVLSRLYLSTCLSNQTFTCVAINNDEIVGVIMGKNEKKHRVVLRYFFRQLGAMIKMLMMKEGRRVLKMFAGFDKINKALLEQCSQKFYGELSFFAVRSDQRGTGIGKELWCRLQAYMNSQGISSYYLYTDNSCNYGFYEHQGMKRLGEKKHMFSEYNNELSFFIYGYNIGL